MYFFFVLLFTFLLFGICLFYLLDISIVNLILGLLITGQVNTTVRYILIPD